MKTNSSVKSRATASSSSSIATRTRKAAAPSATSRKRLRRLHRPVDDDEDEEVEVELSPGSSSSSPGERKRSREDKESDGPILENPMCFIDFDDKEKEGGGKTMVATTGESARGIISSICDRDVDQHPLLSDEMDQIQFELEKSLARAICTQRKLRMALKHLTSGVGQSIVASNSKQSTTMASSAHKRKYPKQQQVAKKPAASAPSTSYSSAAKKNRAGNKDRRLTGLDSMPSCSRSYYYAQQNHQMPDKFWSFVDQYTGNISLTTTAESLRELIRESDPDGAQSKPFFESVEKHAKRRPSSSASAAMSPKASGHSSKPVMSPPASKKGKETKRDPSPANEESASGARNTRASDAANQAQQSRKRGSATPISAPSAKKSRDGAATRAQNGTASNTRSQNNSDNGFSLGPLTERLVQALIEDCDGTESIHDKNGQSTLTTEVKNGLSTSSNPKTLMKTLNLGNLKALENRIKKELIDQGLLDASEEQPERKSAPDHQEVSGRDSRASTTGRTSALGQYEECPEDDEVTAELRRRQYELLCLERSNHERLSNLLVKVESQIDKISKEDNLREADDEVLDLCARYYGVAPTSRKPANKKERDTLTKALKDRDKAIVKLKSSHQ